MPRLSRAGHRTGPKPPYDTERHKIERTELELSGRPFYLAMPNLEQEASRNSHPD